MTTNISKVYLLNVPLEDDMKNTLYFASASAQQSYFNSVIGKTYLNVSYQSETRTFRCKDEIDTIRQYNYIMWQNPAFSNKWFYGFIKKMEFVSTGLTDVVFEVDPLQTYMFDITIKPSFVEREHTNNDTVGANTYPEGLELGEMTTNGATQDFGISGNGFVTVVDVSMMENPGTNQTLSYYFDPPFDYDLRPAVNGIPSGIIHIIIGLSSGSNPRRDLDKVISVYDYAGLGDAIINCYILPKNIIDSTYTYQNLTIVGKSTPTDPNPKSANHLAILAETYNQNDIGTTSFTKPSSVNGYVPRNKKILTYPFCYFNISNNAGTSISYRYEDFSSVSFKTEATFCPGGNVKTIPQNYKNISNSSNAYDYSITGAKYPIIAWNSDSYTNWLTQNAINMEVQTKREVVGAGVDVVSGALRGAIMGGIGGAGLGMGVGLVTGQASLFNLAKEQMLAKTQANLTPDQVRGNINCGDIVWSKMRSKFTYIPMSIKSEYAQICDNYFDAFGYQVNRLKVPNTNHRQNWWYTKTINANIIGNVPNDDMNKIKGAYNNGLTFWKNPSNFLNYGVSNGII